MNCGNELYDLSEMCKTFILGVCPSVMTKNTAILICMYDGVRHTGHGFGDVWPLRMFRRRHTVALVAWGQGKTRWVESMQPRIIGRRVPVGYSVGLGSTFRSAGGFDMLNYSTSVRGQRMLRCRLSLVFPFNTPPWNEMGKQVSRIRKETR